MPASDPTRRSWVPADLARVGELARVRARGFTLVEVLAALVIISLGMLGVIQAVSQTTNNSAYVRERTLAHWIGMNRVTEVRLEAKAPSIGTDKGEVEMAGRKWAWSMEVTQTAVESIRRIDVSVSLPDSKDSSLALVSGFYGSAIAQPGSTANLWPGGAAPGAPPGTPGANPGDPNSPPTDPNNPPPQDPNVVPPQDPTPGGDSPPRTDPEPDSPGSEPQ